jgi:Lon protease-like protein
VHSPLTQKFDELPAEIPLFPLAEVLLLPKGILPLNIFEPRYIAMIDHALKHDRLIGMIQPRAQKDTVQSPSTEPSANSSLYNIGCAGRITSMEETADGRYEIMLSGLCRFAITDGARNEAGFCTAQINWADFEQDMNHDSAFKLDRDHLNILLKKYFMANQLDVCWDTIKQTPNHMLITALSMICPFTAQEKQALLETETCEKRAQYLTSMLEMSIAGSACGGEASRC